MGGWGEEIGNRTGVCWCVFMIKNKDYNRLKHVKLPIVNHFDLYKRKNMIQSKNVYF